MISAFPRSWRLAPLLVSVAVTLAPRLAFAAFSGDPDGSASQPAGAPASAPAPATAPATAPSDAAAKMEAIRQALTLTASQADAYQVALSRRGQIDDPGALTMLLRKIAPLKLKGGEWARLDRPAMENLLAEPNHYAGRPLSLQVYVKSVIKMTPGTDFRASADWTREDGAIYQYGCLYAEAEYPLSSPLIVLSPVDPAFLGKPAKTEDDGTLRYRSPRAQLAGVFYKVYAARDADGVLRDYPVVLAWQLRPATGGGLVTPAAETWSQALGAAIILLVAIVFYFYWRLRQAAKKARDRGLAARGFRQAPKPEEEAKPKKEPPPEEDQADPGLAAAAAEFRKKEGPDAK